MDCALELLRKLGLQLAGHERRIHEVDAQEGLEGRLGLVLKIDFEESYSNFGSGSLDRWSTDWPNETDGAGLLRFFPMLSDSLHHPIEL